MTTLRRNFSAALLLAASALLFTRNAAAAEAQVAATAADEIVVYGKRPAAMELDRDAVRIDVEKHRSSLSANLDRALAARSASPRGRVAAAVTPPRG